MILFLPSKRPAGTIRCFGGECRMRIMTSALLAAGLLSAGIAAAQPCARPTDAVALDIASLKSKLMVTALTCNQQDRYNDFVQRFRSDLMTHERALHAYSFALSVAAHNASTTITSPASRIPSRRPGSGKARCSASRTSASSPR